MLQCKTVYLRQKTNQALPTPRCSSVTSPTMADLAASGSALLNVVFDDRLAHLNLRGQIEELTQAAGAIGASCDVYTGRWRNGDRLVQVAVKKLRFFCSNEPAIAKVRSFFALKISSQS